MNYSEKVEYLKKIDQLSTSDPEIQRRYGILKQEVYEFEKNAFNVILNEIINDKNQIEFLNNQIKQASDNELFKAYCSDKINQHKENITAHGNQIYSMYTREAILDFYTKRLVACQERMEYWQKSQEGNQNNRVAEINLKATEQEMKEINFALNMLNGKDIDLSASYIPVSEVGKNYNF